MSTQTCSHQEIAWVEDNCAEGVGPRTELTPKPVFHYMGHCLLFKEGKKVGKRLIAVGRYRVFLIKKNKVGRNRKLLNSYHLYDLLEISGNNNALVFKWQKRKIKDPKQDKKVFELRPTHDTGAEMVQAIRIAFQQIAPSFPFDDTFKVLVEQQLEVPQFNDYGAGCGFLETYRAHCDHKGVPVSKEVEVYVLDVIERLSSIDMNFDDVPGIEPNGQLGFHLYPLVAALQHNAWFKGLIVNGHRHKDVMLYIANLLRFNTTLTRVQVTNMGEMGGSNAEELAMALQKNKYSAVQVLIFDNNVLGTTAGMLLASAFAEMSHALTHLSLSGCRIGSKAMHAILLAFQKNFAMSLTIQTLNLSGNRFDDVSSKALAEWIGAAKERSSLSRLLLSDCSLNFTTLGSSLRLLSNLVELDVSGNKLDHGCAQLLRTALELSSTLRTVNVSNCGLVAEHAASIILSLAGNATRVSSPTTLFLAHNDLAASGAKGATFLCDALSQAKNLGFLDLSRNKFKKKATLMLMESLAKVPALDTLILDHFTRISSSSFADALSALLNSSSLKALSVAGGFDKGLMRFLPSLSQNETLEELNISNNQMGDKAASLLHDVLVKNSVLQSLHLDNNNFTWSGFKTIRMALHKNFSLRHIPFPWDDFQKAVTALSSAAASANTGHLQAFRMLMLEMDQVLALRRSSSSSYGYVPSRFDAGAVDVVTPTTTCSLAVVPDDLYTFQNSVQAPVFTEEAASSDSSPYLSSSPSPYESAGVSFDTPPVTNSYDVNPFSSPQHLAVATPAGEDRRTRGLSLSHAPVSRQQQTNAIHRRSYGPVATHASSAPPSTTSSPFSGSPVPPRNPFADEDDDCPPPPPPRDDL